VKRNALHATKLKQLRAQVRYLQQMLDGAELRIECLQDSLDEALASSATEHIRKLNELLRAARDRLIHARLETQSRGNECGFTRNAHGALVPIGWRVDGSEAFIRQIDDALRGGP